MNVDQVLQAIGANATLVNLDFRGLESIKPYLSYLQRFPKLKVVSAHIRD